MRHVVGPQALRIAVPPTVGFLVQVIKGTALASVIGFIELTKAGTMITNATFKPFTVYACVALMYFMLCWPVSAASRKLERSFQRMAADSVVNGADRQRHGHRRAHRQDRGAAQVLMAPTRCSRASTCRCSGVR